MSTWLHTLSKDAARGNYRLALCKRSIGQTETIRICLSLMREAQIGAKNSSELFVSLSVRHVVLMAQLRNIELKKESIR